jgi:hypothetical protein
MMRLETLDKELAARIRVAKPCQQRAASLIACQVVLHEVQMDINIVLQATEELRVKGVISHQQIAELNELVDQLDDAYFDLLVRSEDEPDVMPEAMCFFRQARAVSALSFAGGTDSLSAAMESIYEASITLDDATRVSDAVNLVL